MGEQARVVSAKRLRAVSLVSPAAGTGPELVDELFRQTLALRHGL